MEENEIMREQIFTIIDNQLKDNEPPETRINFDRLKQAGFDEPETKRMIATCLAVELFNVMKNREPFNPERYTRNLNNLPKEPFEEEEE